MDNQFENMVGTTGVVENLNYLYVANNKVITRIDNFGMNVNIPHTYDWISSLAANQMFLFGIYKKNDKNGIFSYDLNMKKFKDIVVTYVPMNLIFKDKLIVFDQNYVIYTYKQDFTVIEENQTIPKTIVDIQTNTPYLTMGVAVNKDEVFFTYKNKVIGSNGYVNTVPIDGTIMSIQFYQTFLFILYISVYNQYSFSQYDMSSNLIVKTIEGGYVTGPPIYSCIFDDSLYISASVNYIVEMNQFNLKTPPKLKTLPKTTYPMFELSASNPLFLPETSTIDTQEVKKKMDSFFVTTEPAETSHMYYYIWFLITILYITLIVLTFLFKENRLLRVLILLSLFVAFLFLIKNRVPI
jgi:hypothetical protein